jgi:hypothetical protein
MQASVSASNFTYAATFNESGLPSGTDWTVGVGGSRYTSNQSEIQFLLSNGSYPYTIPPVAGHQALAPSGNVTVAGAPPPAVNVSFEEVFPVTFDRIGIPNGTAWNVTLGSTTNQTTGTSMVFVEPNGSYPYQVGHVPGFHTPSGGNVNLNGSGMSVTVVYTRYTYAVTFLESGLSGGAVVWNVTVANQTNRSSTSDIAFQMINGSYPFTIAPVNGYRESPVTGKVFVNGSSVEVPVSFTPIFPIQFSEAGLPSGSNWTVTIGRGSNSSNNADLVIKEDNGTYHFTVSTTASGYLPDDPNGSVVVNGSAARERILFHNSSVATYGVTFAESGLGVGASWNVDLGGQTSTGNTSTLVIWVTNGTYAFNASASGYDASPAHGNVTVNGTASIGAPITIGFQLQVRAVYAVQFSAAGLPTGTLWSVSVGGVANNTTSETLGFLEPNGTYAYEIGAVAGYRSNGSGTFSINGSSRSIPLLFAPFEFPVTFNQGGLLPGTSWSISVGSRNVSSSGYSLVILEPNGSYSYSVGTPPGFVPPSSGEFTVHGTGVQVPTLQFVPTSGAPPPSSVHPPPLQGTTAVDLAWGIGLLALVIILGAVIWSVASKPSPTAGRRPDDVRPENASAGTPPADDASSTPRGYDSDSELEGWEPVGSSR